MAVHKSEFGGGAMIFFSWPTMRKMSCSLMLDFVILRVIFCALCLIDFCEGRKTLTAKEIIVGSKPDQNLGFA